jgi:hypothetical protein
MDPTTTTPEHAALLRAMTTEATELLGRPIAPDAVQLASDTANALGMPADLPLATLLAVSELALRLRGEPPLTVAAAIMTLLAAQAAATPSKPKRPKHSKG